MRSVGMVSTAFSGSIYNRRVLSRAANVNLSIRSARVSEFCLILSRISFFPTMIPACGPPRSLSPLKVTTSAPDATDSWTVGSFINP